MVYLIKELQKTLTTDVDDETARDANRKLTDKNRTNADIPGEWKFVLIYCLVPVIALQLKPNFIIYSVFFNEITRFLLENLHVFLNSR